MKKLFLLFVFLLSICADDSKALLPGQTNQIFTGFATAAAVAQTVTVPNSTGYAILLDGSGVGTSSITVAIQVLQTVGSTYQTPTNIGNPGVANPITLANGTSQFIMIPTGWPSIQVNVTSFGTATGTFRTVILAY